MKPNFALSLSFEGIKLLHRAAGGWREVGEVSVTADDLTGELAVLRKTASGLEPGGVRSKLVIPEGQIKYLTIDTLGLSEAACRKAAENALHDATPYDISELAYDISLDGAKTHVAAVARETLAEAEAFATEHRFHPVSFVAVPGDAPYLGEPFFGPTKGAADLLEPKDVVEPDDIAVIVLGSISTEPVAPEEPTSEITKPLAAAPMQATEKPPLPEIDGPVVEPKSQPTAPQPKPEQIVEQVKKPTTPEPNPATETEPTAAIITPKAGHDTKTAPNSATALAATAGVAPKKPTLSSAKKVQKPQAEAVKSTTSFTSRRVGTSATPKPLGGAQRVAVTTVAPDSSSLNQPAPVADVPAPATPKIGFLSRRKPRTDAAAPPAPTPPAAHVATVGQEAERMTVFGARTDQVGGKPRFLGLIMTVILLVFLAGVAAWAAVFLDEGIAGLLNRGDTRTTASAPENQIDPQIIRTPDGIEESDPTVSDGIQIAALDPVLSAEDTAVLDALQDTRPEPQRPVITQQEAAARYAVTGIWPLSPSTPLATSDTLSEPVYRNGIDAVSSANDAIALPDILNLETDIQLAAAISPPPYGQQTILGAGGLIVPTAAGVVAPGGYTLFAASPPLKPPPTLARFATQSNVTAPIATLTTTPSPLLDFRPKNRPLGLAERSERAQLGGVSRVELAAYRPSLRPRSLQDRAKQAEEAARASEEARATAAATAAAAAALAIPEPVIEELQSPPTVTSSIQSATKFAIAESIRPDTRPRNFARIVKRAKAAAPKATRVASVAPRTVSPKIPSKASVARSATVKNAINLRKVNLIGVYGKPTSRRALVRLSNGRYMKVSVGDRIDGGRVSAISNSELRYAKGGRNVVLKMP